ncbi:hypothetical protein JKF63_07613 [Porcisia hertigi]|uniref:Hemagluttinin family protein n=1 Tax=Porcisia hertigi TaxID=2761500 RepID=A0A836IQH3_9TRYP|nr:hypothetical protein JKF63_07613 [Porcisia hertigi]
MGQVPIKWTSSPTQVQVNAPVNIIFYGDDRVADYLTADDVALLVLVPDGAVPGPSMCPRSEDWNRDDVIKANSNYTIITQGTMTKPGPVNTQWAIPANVLLQGVYVVCYKAKNSGQPVYVSSPATLVVYQTQSPSGAYLARSAASIEENLNLLQGERVFLLFHTTVELDVVLDGGQGSSKDKDVVRITTDNACQKPLGAGTIDEIPAAFGYAPLGILNETTDLPVPYVHLRARATPGNYYICMRRRNRESWQAYYDFEVVGGLHVNPAVLKVGGAAVSAFTTSPTTPRVWVPHVVVSATYGPGVSMKNMTQFFFVPFTGTGSVTEIDEINHDSCYRPSSTLEASSASVTLVNRTLQVYLVNPMFTQHSFGLVGTYLLCYQQSGRNIASVFPTALPVANPSPTTYAVPEMIPIQNAFTMNFSAIDPIFAAGNKNVAQIYIVDDVMATLNCSGATAPIGGTTHFTNFTSTHTTQASVTPTIMKSGYFFVCFLAYDQKEYFPVPNAAGDFIFSVGLMGAQEYTVTPSPAYLGQLLDVAIVGYQLSNRDHVKIVRISSDELSSEDDMTSDDRTSDDMTSDDRSSMTQCTEHAENADASEPAGAAGSVVQSTSGTLAHYHPRVNETGTFILCYQSVLWENAWIWVSKIPQFTVGAAHPTHYTLSVAPAYETEVLSLHIHDSGSGGGTGTEGRLRPEDKVKLIDRGTGDRGFDCTASATTSSSVGLLSYVSAESDSRVNVYRICGSAVANLTVCYALSEGRTTMLSWAEVPRQSPPPTYLFAGVLIEGDPFVGPMRGSSGADWVPPRPYEPFTFFFTSEVAKLEVQRVDFAREPVSVCAVDVDYVAPLLYQKEKEPASTFTVSLPHAGNYVVYISRDAAETAPKIMHRTQLVVGKCDPCSFTPSYGLAGKDVLLSFRSSVGGSLSNADEVRLFPVPQGLKGRPCEEISGPYAGVTLKPIEGQSTSDLTVFSVTTGTEAEASKYLGEYYVCYRKMAASSGSLTANFAVVAENNGVASIFSVYPADFLTATTCPASSMNALQSAVYNVTARNPAMYPNVPFSDSDVLVVVPSDVLEGIAGGCEGVTDVKTLITESGGRAQLATLDAYGRGYSNWYLTFASQTATVSYRWCFKLEHDALFRDISTSPQNVARENPYEVTTNPPVILPQSAPVRIQITGTGLVSTDRVYIVPAEESCLETCHRPAAPTEWQDVPHTVQYVSSTSVLVTFSKPIETLVSLGVCYRRTSQYLTRLATIVVREPNPVSYTTSFAPRVGTRPGLVFTGKSLTKGDALILVQPGTPCLVRDAVATGTFVSVSSDGTTSHFLLALVGDGIRAQDYTVCYEISTVGAYAEVQPKLSVLEGGPSSVLSSNTPMRGRATVLTVADPQAGDEMYVACVGCSCFDEQEAVVPYGDVHAIAQVTETASSSRSVTITLRVGFNDTKGYPICYRRSDSGYAQIGGTTTFVTPATNSPSGVTQLPASTQYQGQRLVYNFVNYTAAVPLDGADRVMLVQQSRSCWDNLDINKDGVVVDTSVLTGTIPATGVGEWKAHIPSLGPGVPPATPALFPLSYVVCYRQAGQLEYVGVPYAVQTTLMKAADPAIFETVPAIVEKGMLEVSTTFSYTDAGNDGDEAYVVQFETLTNTVCDDDKSVVVSPRGGAYPVYKLSMSGSAVVGTNRTAVCYIRAGATVAEVPQLLTVVESNPSGYVTNVADTGVARERQYIEFTIMGSDLSTANDAVVFTDVPCAKAPRPFTSSPHLARLGDATSDGATYKVVAQFISLDAPVDIYVCYQHNSVWREVGAALTLSVPVPLSVTVISSSETKTMPRAGQHLNLQLVGGTTTSVIDAAVLSARTAWKGTWCHNFTEDDVQEPALAIWSAAILDVSVWQVPGEARLCIHNDANTLWADAASTVDAPSIYINPPNPSTMDTFPNPPRVGQSVTLTFHLLVSSSVEDVVRVTAPSYEACEAAKSVEAFPDTMSVTVVDEHTTTLTLIDSTDPLRYRSFETVGDYRVCYYSATELAWGVVGGTLTAGSVTVKERVPESWSIASGHTTIGLEFTLAFTDKLGILQPSVNKDVAWAAPSTVNCGQDPHTCSGCLLFEWDTSKSSPNKAVTLANASVRVDEMNLCYRLSGATAALVPGPLNITTGPIQCVEEDFFISGQRQRVTFRIEDGTDVTKDSWRLSFYATTALNCDERYIDSFLPGSARLESSTSTSATYSVLWPPGLGITTDRYTICYTHKNLVGPVCTCGQIDAKTGECYMTGTPGSPQSFTPSPQPTYVGQTITLSLAVNASMTAYPPTAIKLVTYVDELTDCDGAPAFTPAGATLTRVSAVLYTYVFKHDYTLGSATLVVCALTDLSTSYVRVASTVVPSSPTTSNTLWIRPYLVLTTFPSTEDYLRAMQTLNLTFTMASQQKDDVVSLKDRLTVVSDPRNCVESYINEQDPATLMKMFYLSDTAFLTLPATVLSANTAKFHTKSLATFSNDKVSQGTHYFCYLLQAGTWAPVLPGLTIREGLINSCSVTGALSPANGDHEDPSHPSTSNGGSLRAMYYAPTQILGTPLFASLVSPLVDEVRVVPQNQWCTNDAAAVFTITVGELSPLDESRVDPTDSIAAVFFAPLSGAYKLCYRFGTNSNWSPACTDLQVTTSTPTGATVGCLNVGQTVAVMLTQAISGQVFTNEDRLRFVQGTLPCLVSGGALTASSATVTVGDAPQPTYGVVLSDVTPEQTFYPMAAALFRTGTSAVRLCYTDAAGNQFAVPLNYASDPGKSFFAIQPRQPSTVDFPHARVQVGQRLFMKFSPASAEVRPLLVPYAPLPSPYMPGPAFNGTFDGATLLAVSSASAYTDGRCAAALRDGTLAATSFLGVYGPPTREGGNGPAPYTVGNFDPTEAQLYIACYHLAKCSAADSGDPFRVDNANPSKVRTDVEPPRRGQLIKVLFERDTSTPGAAALTPGSDLGAKEANLASCWTLSDTAGEVVQGTPDLTYITTIFPAQAPAQASPTQTRSCYKMSDSSWSEVPGGVADVLPANPASFDTVPASARVSGMNYINFYGSGFSGQDRVKLIEHSANCSEDSVPPPSFAAYSVSEPTEAIPGTAQGWTVTGVNKDGSTATLNFVTTVTGTYSVCYRLAADTVWTLVYADLVIYERNPSEVTRTPVTTLEGELFTLTFTASTQGTSGLSAEDRVVLYYGSSVNCIAPTEAETAPSVTAAPSLTETLPQSISFQMDVGTRGSYTLCYKMALPGVPGGYIVVWDYDTVVVESNPQEMMLYPVREPSVHRPNELLTSLFIGWGLVSTTEAPDSMKLIQASAEGSTTDAMCQKNPSAATITYYPLYANGTHAEQVWRVSSDGVNVPYSVCYKLSGGQYHVIGNPLSITGTASPSGATSEKLTGPTTTLLSGESISWTLVNTNAESCADGAAILFFSDSNCYDVHYYTDVSALIPSSTLMEMAFPAGAVVVSKCSDATRLRASWTYAFAGSSSESPETAPSTALLSLCYWSAGNNAVSVLASDAITLSQGVPPPLNVSLLVTAEEVFSFDLSVSPTITDWIVLVKDPTDCVGVSSPANDAYFTDVEFSATTGVLTVTAAVPAAGMYYVCYSHQVGICAAATGRECARVVAAVEATASSPQGWSGTPTPVYVSGHLAVSLTFASHSESSARETTASAWLAAMKDSESSLTMKDVWMACAQSQTTPSLRHVLTYTPATGKWDTGEIFTRSGPYALCYTAESVETAALHLFGPVTNAGPVVLPSTVTDVSLPPLMTIKNTNTVVLRGGGLSTTDVVVAVALDTSTSSTLNTAARAIPSDICTNEDYVPRVISTNPDSTTSTGMSSMLRNLVFTETGDYVLCYTATYSLTTGDGASERGSPVLITPTPFTVSPSVVSMTVTSLVLEVGVELDILFAGNGLTASNTAALVFVGNTTESPTVESVCLDSNANYEAMKSASEDGTTAVYSTTPTQQGIHMVCFRQSSSSTPILMPTRLDIGVRSAIEAVFTVQPDGCAALLTCMVQPTITLLDTSALPTSAPYSTVKMVLYLSDGTTEAPPGYLSGDTAHSQVNYTTFTFLALRVSTSGQYIMKAIVELPGGDTLVATSDVVNVTTSGESVVNVASVSCLPEGILDRTSGSTTDTIDCTIEVLISDAPNMFTVDVNAGTVSPVTQSGTTSSGLPMYKFTVTAPEMTPSLIGLVNYIVMLVKPITPFEGWPVQNSPVTVRLATSPSAQTTIGCSADATELPQSNMVRVGGILNCRVQGIAMIGGQPRNIVARPQDLRVTSYYNGQESTSTPVDLGAYPVDINGLYNFTVTPSTGLSIFVAGSVFASEYVSTSTSTTTPAWTVMTNSPQMFILIGVPADAASKMTCVSKRTGSKLWYKPTELLECTVALANAKGPVNGVQSDYSVQLPNGGSVSEVEETFWGSSLTWQISAPPQPSLSSLSSTKSQQHAEPVDAEGGTFDNGAPWNFHVRVLYTPSNTIISTYEGTLVSVMKVVGTVPTLKPGKTVSLTLAGFGLATTHLYTLSAPSNCSSVLAQATPREGRETDQLILNFRVPSSTFIICFAPEDARTAFQPLLPTQWTPASENPWTTDDLVLLIVGVIFLFILLVLLVILLWCIFYGRRGDEEEEEENKATEEHRIMHFKPIKANRSRFTTRPGGKHVYMPPRANDRYVLRTADKPRPIKPQSPAPLPMEATPTPPSQEAQQQQQQQQPSSNNTHIRINIRDNSESDHATPHPQSTPGAAMSLMHPGGGNSNNNSGDARPPLPKRRRRHHSHRTTTTTSSNDSLVSDHPVHPLRHQSKSKYANLDPSIPPLPPMPSATPSPIPGLVESPRKGDETPATHAVENLPRLPPPPASPSGPYQHLHHRAPEPTVPGRVDAPGAGQSNLHRGRRDDDDDDDDGATKEFVGPFTVVGHTSKPMVRSSSCSGKPQTKPA